MYNTQLETFLVVADQGSFNKAAETLYISAPAVTKQINFWRAAWACSFLCGHIGGGL